MEVPVYAFAGFLDAGKTRFMNNILADGFARDERTLLLCCEEGENAYDPKVLRNVTVLTVEDREDLTAQFLARCEKEHRPEQVLIEYNGMWPLEPLCRELLPKNWVLYQIMTIVDARSFDVYVKNMGQLMMEKVLNADMLVFNRCTPELAEQLRKRNLRMVNRRADMYLEYADGRSEEYLTGDECPFDLTQEVIEIPDDDFGVWYVDVTDHPERYEGKKVHVKLVMCHSKQFPGVCCPGRFAMVCCAQDVQFLGLIAQGAGIEGHQDRDWLDAVAQVKTEKRREYRGTGPVLHLLSLAPADPADPDVVGS